MVSPQEKNRNHFSSLYESLYFSIAVEIAVVVPHTLSSSESMNSIFLIIFECSIAHNIGCSAVASYFCKSTQEWLNCLKGNYNTLSRVFKCSTGIETVVFLFLNYWRSKTFVELIPTCGVSCFLSLRDGLRCSVSASL